jgi:hypothetical protein
MTVNNVLIADIIRLAPKLLDSAFISVFERPPCSWDFNAERHICAEYRNSKYE